MIPQSIELSFVALVFGLYLVVLAYLWRGASMRIGGIVAAAALMCSWLGASAYFAASGLLVAEPLAMPPTMLRLVVGPALLAVVLLASLPATGRMLANAPADWLVSFQAFRIPMELILYGLYTSGHWHRRLTFEGANFDIATGVLALGVGYLMHKGRAGRGLVIAFNVVGLVLLTTIVVMALLSAPTPMLHFADEPLNRVVLHLPLVWLPGFVVPLALLGHLLSLRQLLQRAVLDQPNQLEA